jgi:hypothetical protein
MSALFMKNVTFDTRKNNLQQPVMSTSLFRVVIDGQLQGNFFPTSPHFYPAGKKLGHISNFCNSHRREMIE